MQSAPVRQPGDCAPVDTGAMHAELLSTVRRLPFAALVGPIRDALDSGGRVRFRVEGNSMLPWLRGGADDVILIPAGGRAWGVGDIVLIRDPKDRFILHRVTRRHGGEIWLMGDAQSETEGPWAEERVEAVVERVVHWGRDVDMSSFEARAFARIWRAVRPFRRRLLALAFAVRARTRRPRP